MFIELNHYVLYRAWTCASLHLVFISSIHASSAERQSEYKLVMFWPSSHWHSGCTAAVKVRKIHWAIRVYLGFLNSFYKLHARLQQWSLRLFDIELWVLSYFHAKDLWKQGWRVIREQTDSWGDPVCVCFFSFTLSSVLWRTRSCLQWSDRRDSRERWPLVDSPITALTPWGEVMRLFIHLFL